MADVIQFLGNVNVYNRPGNAGMNYEMGGTILSKTVKEKDLRVTMNANMKVSEQCRIAASKGNQVIGMIRRNITYKENSLIVPLYKAIFRPHLDYCIQAWNPHLRKDINMLEKIQRRATKLIPGRVIFFSINAPGTSRFQLLNLGVLGYGLELRFWVVIAIIVSLTLTMTLTTTLTII